jgi:predicted ATPase/DNA-binding XRE family transcriptional regulator
LAKTFGDLLRRYRGDAGLTQEALAERAGMSLAAVGKLERGTRQRPYPATIAILAKALSLSPHDRLELERAARRSANRKSSPAHETETAIHLPINFSTFIGRKADLEKMCEMLATHRLVTLVGAGGVGKTRLAIRAAEQFITMNPTGQRLDAAWFVDLSSLTDGALLVMAVASSIGLDQRPTMDALGTYLRAQSFLLIIDNCEHLLDAAAQVIHALLSGCQGARILTTSRQAIGLEGERVYRVPPLDLPDAIRLFQDRAEATDSRFELSDEIVPAVTEICQRVDGIALAIELAASRTNAFPPALIAEQIGEHFASFSSGLESAFPYRKTMRSLFDWSYTLLEDRERELMRRLSIFAGGFTLDLAQALYAGRKDQSEIPGRVASLVDKSLVQCDIHAGPRYKLLEPVREYARERLLAHMEYGEVARSHALALLAVAEDFDSRLEVIPDQQWDECIVAERDNFRAAFDWTLGAAGDSALGQRLAASAAATWNGFLSGEVITWTRVALETCDETTPLQLRAKLAISEARKSVHFDPYSEARIEICRYALSLQPPDDHRAIAMAQYYLGLTFLSMGRYDESETMLRDALASALSAGANIEYNLISTALGAALASAGEFREARKYIAESVQRSEAAGSKRYAAAARVELAEVEFASGATDDALRLNEESVHFFRSHSLLIRLPIAYCNSAAYLTDLGRFQEARDHAREALRHSRVMGNVNALLWAMQHLAVVAILVNDPLEGEMEALHRAAEILGFVDEAQRRRGKARYHTEQRSYDRALMALRRIFDGDKLKKLMTEAKAWSEERAFSESMGL